MSGSSAGLRSGMPGGPARDVTRVDLRVGEMDCPSCVLKIESRLRELDGVRSASGSPVSRTLSVEFEPGRVGPERIREEVEQLGYATRLAGDDRDAGLPGIWSGPRALLTYGSVILFVTAVALVLAGVDRTIVELPLHDVHVPDVFFLLAAAVGGWNFFPKGVRAALRLSLDMNFLMTVAILGAVGIGEYMEAGAIAFLFSLAELLEAFSVERARKSVESLMSLAPGTARLIRDGREVEVPVQDLRPGDRVVVRSGERIPADGRVDEGASAVDESAITGESMPLEKAAGDGVYAGTINREGFLRVVVTRTSDESTLARIVHLVEEAESRKTRSERFVERFARYYTPAVTIGALLVVAVPTLFFDGEFLTWFLRGLTLLVIACPCALVISTPVAVVSGVTAAARHGILIKGGVHLEALGRVKVLAFDKTGTLTTGRPEVVEVLPLNGVGEVALLARAAAVEAGSGHPIAAAIVRAARERGAPVESLEVRDFTSVPGRGARAWVDGVEHVVGRPDLVGEVTHDDPTVAALTNGGRTVIGVAAGDRLLGWIALADRPRVHAAEAIERIRAEGIERVVLLTGDNPETAEAIGRELGVDEVLGGLLPEDKVDAVKALEDRYGPVAMVGDGVNDAPALAAATVGIAMGAAGSDTALEAADVALMGDDLGRLPYALRLARRSDRVIRENVLVSILAKGALAVGVPLGMVSLILAVVAGDIGVTLAVIANALRLARVPQ